MAEVVVIDCNTWYRGQGGSPSALLKPNGCRCCLGFVLQQRGFADAMLSGTGEPCEVETERAIAGLTTMGEGDDEDPPTHVNTDTCLALMSINDNQAISDAERMAQLNEQAAEIGIHFEFINAPSGQTAEKIRRAGR